LIYQLSKIENEKRIAMQDKRESQIIESSDIDMLDDILGNNDKTKKIFIHDDNRFGRAFFRISKALRDNVDSRIQFTDSPIEADVELIHYVGYGEALESYRKCKNKPYICFMHCTGDALEPEITTPVVKSFLQNAVFIYTFHPLDKYIDGLNLMIGPWGVDSTLFHPCRAIKPPLKYSILSTGYVAETEAISEIYQAVKACNGRMAHVGHNFKYGNLYDHYEGVSDERMINLYQNSVFTSGLRRTSGFELPVLEGMCCGSRPIIFDNEYYTKFFSDFAITIPESDTKTVTDALYNIFTGTINYPTDTEIANVASKFDWKVVFGREFWNNLTDAICK
jgi:hypothetical protein